MPRHGNVVSLSPGLFQPIAADDVAPIVAEVALAVPRNGIVEIAGPERAPFNEIVARYLKAAGDPREVVRDPRPDTGAAASVSTNGSAALLRQKPDPHPPNRRMVP